MAYASSPSPVFTRSIISQDDSAPSTIQIRRHQHQSQSQTSRSVPHSPDNDDEDEDDDDDSDDDDDDDDDNNDDDDHNDNYNDNVAKALNEQPSSSVFHEENGWYYFSSFLHQSCLLILPKLDVLINVLKSHIELIGLF